MNEVQKNFNKQMKQSLKELKRKDKDAYHEYVKWNHLDDSKSRIKEETRQMVVSVLSSPFKVLIKIVGLVMIVGISYNFVKGINSQTQLISTNISTSVMYNKLQTIRTGYGIFFPNGRNMQKILPCFPIPMQPRLIFTSMASDI